MKIKKLVFIFCASAAFWTPAQAATVIEGDFTLGEGNLPGALNVTSTGTQTGTTVNGVVNTDGSAVSFSSNRALTITGGGAATIAPLSGIIDLLTVNFEKGWDNITFNFGGGSGVFDLSVNNGSAFFSGGVGGNCDICSISNGQNRFVLNGSGITNLVFNFRPGINSVTQFRLEGLSNMPAVPEPATWAMMLLGLGLVGGAMRAAKRRQKVTLSYA
jgi:hypothetical protein